MPKNNLSHFWLNSSKVSTKDKNIIRKMSKKELDIFFDDSIMRFGTAGIRATLGPGTKQFNKFTYAQLAFAYGKFIKNKFKKNLKVVIGHDNRIGSIEYSKLCAEVLSSFGIKAYMFKNNELMPTPIISYAIRELKACGGIIITASHNPKDYNGFKAYNPDGGQILPDVAKQIEKLMPAPSKILDIKYKPNIKNICSISQSVVDSYLTKAKCAIVDQKIIKQKKSFPIIFTGHHGTSCKLLPKFLKSLGFNVIPVKEQCYSDPMFTNSPSSNPEFADSFKLSIKYANKYKSKICIGIDPDADRMAVMINHNGKWTLMTGNQMGILYSWYILSNKKFTKTPYIVSSYVSTDLIDNIAKKFKAKVYRTGTGFKWMGDIITKIGNKEQFVVAFEEAIGALNTTLNRDKDSFTASAAALEIYTKYLDKGMDFIDILEQIIYPEFGYWYGETVSYNFFGILDWKPVVQKRLEQLKTTELKKVGNYKITKVIWNTKGDCLDWILSDKSWIRFRVSGTEPKFKVYYNLYAKDKTTLALNTSKAKADIAKLFK